MQLVKMHCSVHQSSCHGATERNCCNADGQHSGGLCQMLHHLTIKFSLCLHYSLRKLPNVNKERLYSTLTTCAIMITKIMQCLKHFLNPSTLPKAAQNSLPHGSLVGHFCLREIFGSYVACCIIHRGSCSIMSPDRNFFKFLFSFLASPFILLANIFFSKSSHEVC